MFPERHPLIAYFVLTFGISWGGVLLVVWPGGFPPTQATFERLLPLAVAAMLAGPTVGGILATWLRSGTPGVRELWTRIRRPGAAARWWVIALLTAPILMSGVLFALSALAPEYLPGILATGDPGGLLRFGLVLGLAAGVFEELGWTGVALPLLRRRFGVAASGLILGVVWAAWHLLPAWWFSTRTTVPGSTAAVLLDPFLFLVGYRVLMVWVWEQTRSLPVAMGMHASLTASARILGPLQMAGTMLLAHDVVWAVVVGLIVATVIDAGDRVATRRRAI
jgi:membrane protease YdiL (CAAX protease family)